MKGIGSTTSQGVKKMIPQLILSLSIFSFLYSSLLIQSYSSSSSPKLLIHCYNASASSPLLNKNCLFLICNGLLVFLARTSGFLVHPPPRGKDLAAPMEDRGDSDYEKSGGLEGREEEQATKGIARRTEEVSIAIAESEEEGKEEPGRFWIFDEEDEARDHGSQLQVEELEQKEDEEEDAEELNRRFEEFIRRMKKEILVSTEPANSSSTQNCSSC